MQGSQKIQVEIKSRNSGPPRFKEELRDVVVCENATLDYRLPLIIDPDQDDDPVIKSIDYNGVENFIN